MKLKKLIMLFLLVSFMCFGEEKIEPKKSYEVIQREEIDFLKTQLIKSNNKIDDLSEKIEKLEYKEENNFTSTYSVDQIYQNSMHYYDSALKDTKWLIERAGVIVSILLTALIGSTWYVKSNNNRKLEEERKVIIIDVKELNKETKNEVDKRVKRMWVENEKLKEKLVEQEKEVKRKTLKLDEKIKDVEFNTELSIVLSESRDEERKMDLRRLIKKYSKNYWDKIYFQLGWTYENSNKYNAILMYDEAIKLNSKYVEAYINRGKAYKHIEKYNEAIKDFDEAIELEPNNEESYYNKAISKEKLGEVKQENSDYKKAKQYYKEALDDYKITLELEPSHGIANQNKDRVERKLEELEGK